MYKTLINKIPYPAFIKNVSFLMGGTFAANIMGMFFSPLITRIFTPENFGAFAFFSTIGAIIATISTLSFDQAIIVESDDQAAITLTTLTLSLVICIAFVLTTFLYIFNEPFSKLFNQPEFHQYSLLLFVFIILRNGLNIFNNLLIRKKKFKSVASGKFIESLSSGAIKLALGFFIGASAAGLVGGLVLGIVCTFVFIGIENLKVYPFEKIKEINFRKMQDIAKKYQDFAKYNCWTSLINHLSQNMMVLFLSIFYSLEIVGLYALARRIISLPVQYVSDSFYKVYYQKSSEQVAHGQFIAQTMKKATIALALISIIPFICLFIFAPSLFAFVFGQGWETSGVYVRCLAPGFFLVFINRPAQATFLVLRKLKTKMVYTILLAISRGIALFIGYYYFNSVYYCFILYSGVIVIFNFWMIIQAYRFATESCPAGSR